MTPTEDWRTVEGFPDYEVSSEGRIRFNGDVLNPPLNSNGYLRLAMVPEGGGRKVRRYVHQLVAVAFHGPRPAGKEVRHLNGQPLDCRAVNLAWDTHRRNMLDIVDHGAHYSANKERCPQGHPYDGENTYVTPGRPTARYCRACRKAHSLAYYHRRAARKAVAA